MRTGHRTDYVKLDAVKTLLATEYVLKENLPTDEEIENLKRVLSKTPISSMGIIGISPTLYNKSEEIIEKLENLKEV